METVAVYYEEIIRTYGFDVREGLTLVRVPTADDALLRLREALPGGDHGLDLVMAAAAMGEDGLALWVVLGSEATRALRERVPEVLAGCMLHPVDVVHFHGPHFGDRYGIAHAAQSALDAGGVERLAVSCTGASVYLAVPDGEGARAVASLRRAFTTASGSPHP